MVWHCEIFCFTWITKLFKVHEILFSIKLEMCFLLVRSNYVHTKITILLWCMLLDHNFGITLFKVIPIQLLCLLSRDWFYMVRLHNVLKWCYGYVSFCLSLWRIFSVRSCYFIYLFYAVTLFLMTLKSHYIFASSSNCLYL